jgi:hypothetical protein
MSPLKDSLAAMQQQLANLKQKRFLSSTLKDSLAACN